MTGVKPAGVGWTASGPVTMEGGVSTGPFPFTDAAPLLKGAGHFEDTSIWNGNIAVAGHNRGVRNDFGKIHTLKAG